MSGRDTGVAELVGGAGCRSEAFDNIAALFGCPRALISKAWSCRTSPPFQPLHHIARSQNLLSGGPLSDVQMLLLFGMGGRQLEWT